MIKLYNDGREICGEAFFESDTLEYICTRNKGHRGEHAFSFEVFLFALLEYIRDGQENINI